MENYNKELWIYSIMVIIATIASGITGITWSWQSNDWVNVITPIIGFVIFLYATIRLALFLNLKPRQWVAALVLVLLFYVGSVLYMTTRKPRIEGAATSGAPAG